MWANAGSEHQGAWARPDESATWERGGGGNWCFRQASLGKASFEGSSAALPGGHVHRPPVHSSHSCRLPLHTYTHTVSRRNLTPHSKKVSTHTFLPIPLPPIPPVTSLVSYETSHFQFMLKGLMVTAPLPGFKFWFPDVLIW